MVRRTTKSTKKSKTGLNIRVVNKKDTSTKKDTKKKVKSVKKETKPKKSEIIKKKKEKKDEIHIHNEEKTSEKKKDNLKSPVSREEALIIYEEIEHNKKIIMWSSVTVFMVLIVFFWIIGVKQTIKQSNALIQDKASAKVWNDKTKELEFDITEMHTNLEKINSYAAESKENLDEIKTKFKPDNEQPFNTETNENENEKVIETKTEELSEEEIKDIKNKIKELEAKLPEDE